MASDTEPAKFVEPDASDIESGSPLGAGTLEGAYETRSASTAAWSRVASWRWSTTATLA